ANHARNLGLDQCKTEWIYFFDCDDEFTPSFLGELMPHASSERDLLVFPTNLVINGRVQKRSFVTSISVASQILSSTLNTQGMLIRTSFLREVGGWDSRLQVWQDWELGIRLLLHHPRVSFLPERAYHLLHQHPDSLTGPSMASRMVEREQTISVVEAEINDDNSRHALCFRLAILNGMLLREGANTSNLNLPSSWFVNVVSRFLTFYTRMGGRGAWRLVLMFCKS
ncbi:MAG: glycosyltransferase, partial [Bacteroidaceae bacterium]|nr:glycosyltransferase [Bacteroidaceae bacterium]